MTGPATWLATSSVPRMVREWANRARGSDPCAERVTPGWMTIDGATRAQRLPVTLVARTQVMPGGVDVPVSVSSEALVAMVRVAVVGVAQAEATNCGVPRAIDEQIGLRSTTTSESTA